MTNYTFRTFRELKRLSREFLLGKYVTPILAIITASILPALLIMPFSTSTIAQWNAQTAIYAAAAAIIGLLAQLLNAGIIRIHLLLAKQQPISFTDLFWTFRNQPDRFLLGALLKAVVFLVPIIPAGICLLICIRRKTAATYLIIAAAVIIVSIILLYLNYSFRLVFPLYIEHKDMSVLNGFRLSLRYMRGNKMRCFLLQLSFLGWRLLGLCSLGIGMLWISPYISQTQANFYLDLTQQLYTVPPNETESSAQ